MRWVAENKRPFAIVKDRAFLSLMKTGRPDYKVPSPSTVSRDVKEVFANCRSRVAKMLQVSCCYLWYTVRLVLILSTGLRRRLEFYDGRMDLT